MKEYGNGRYHLRIDLLVRRVKSTYLQRSGHAIRRENISNEYNILVGKPLSI
jgi:hypothetical protein